MNIQYKAVGVKATAVEDEGNGIVSAIVSVTGVVDNVRDIILPGAYEKTLKTRKPKGVWHHSWTDPISKTLDVKELLPGDPELPTHLPNGDPWPTEAGALKVRMQFNLKTAKGRDSYENVIFYADEQEWSIGYQVPAHGATKTKDGVREIKVLDLYEYSPVLFGAMPAARTVSVKSAQEAFAEIKSLKGDEAEAFLMELKTFAGDDISEKRSAEWDEEDEDIAPDDEQGLSFIEDLDEEDFEEEDGDAPALSAAQAEQVESAINALQELLDSGAPRRYNEKAWSLYEFKGLDQIADDAELDEELVDEAVAFDEASEDLDEKSMLEHAAPILEHIEHAFRNGEGTKEMSFVVNYITAAFKEAGFEEDDEEMDDEEVLEDEDGLEDDEEKTITMDLSEIKSLFPGIDLT